MKRKTISLSLMFVLLITMVVNLDQMQVRVRAAGPDLYIKDTPADTGVEPNPDSGAMYVSQDIWVRNSPDPNYRADPFPDASPTWTPQPHENPEYRDPKYSRPNYVYVRVRNRGDMASLGTEKLRIFWAKASTGLGWPTQWGGGPWTQEVDYQANVCGPTKLYGQELTKPRKNAANATSTERNAYRDAIFAIGTTPGLAFPGGVTYWHKQQEIHQDTSYPEKHQTALFTPWHREMINRYEILLQEHNPSVKLFYWDWTQNPETGSFNYYPSFMGASGSGAGSALIGAPFNPSSGTTLAPPNVRRDLAGYVDTAPNPDFHLDTPTTTSDASMLARLNYANAGATLGFRDFMESFGHNWSHVYIGGQNGDMTDPATSTRDPFFFLLHTDVDRLWAKWQRNVTKLPRLDPATTYDTESSNLNITNTMEPWNGHAGSPDVGIRPWTAADGYVVDKTGLDVSVVSPPIYDDAPLVIPVLQPGQSVVMQIPWYPPNPANYSGNGCDQGHFCLLSRIETTTSGNFGMTFAEVTNVNTNTRNNNNIAWKNLHVVDDFAGLLKMSSLIVRNLFNKPVLWGLRLEDVKGVRASFFDFGRVVVNLPPELLKRWRDKNREVNGIKIFRDKDGREKIEITSREALLQNVELKEGEAFPVTVEFELRRDYKPTRTPLKWDIVQTGAPDDPRAVVGGQRFELDISKLTLVKKGSQWRYWTKGAPDSKWTSTDFDDSKWKTGQAELGYTDDPMTTIEGGPVGKRNITSYFRHTFSVNDPEIMRDAMLRLKRDDGALVYLNGTEIYRANMPRGVITATTLATREVSGVEEEVFYPVKVDPKLLRAGRNTVAVELHQNSPRTDDASFDLELTANNVATQYAPNITFAQLRNGSLWQKGQVIPLSADALDGDGKIRSVSFFVDGKLAGTVDQPPFAFDSKDIPTGIHRVRVVATDNDGQEATQELTISVLDNTPPFARLTLPANGAVFMPGAAIRATAEASDFGGKVQRVDFYLKGMNSFMAATELVGTATKPPYSISFERAKPGHYMLWAVAVDDLGSTSQSIPVHISIGMNH